MRQPCQACDLHAKGLTTQGDAFEKARAHRITLGLINGAGDAVALIAHEIGDCHPCTARFASLNAGMTAALFITYYGSADRAAAEVQHLILAELDNTGGDGDSQ